MSIILIEFTNSPNDTYFPGQFVEGRIILNNQDSIKSRFLKVCINGSAETFRRKSENEVYSDSVTYFDSKTDIWKCTDGSNRLPPCHMIIPFRFQLPIDLPPSFKGFHGHISYSVYVELGRVWGWNRKTRKFLTVAPIYNLNTIPQATIPAVKTVSKNMGMIFKKGIISMNVRIVKRGFIVGENIDIQMKIDNKSELQIYQFRAKIIQISSSVGKRYTKGVYLSSRVSKDEIVAEKRKKFKVPTQTTCLMTMSIKVPKVCPSFGNCSIISLDYFLCVDIDVNEVMVNNLNCEIPIFIGTVPINGAPTTSTNEPSPSLSIDNPPSYEELMNNNLDSTWRL